MFNLSIFMKRDGEIDCHVSTTRRICAQRGASGGRISDRKKARRSGLGADGAVPSRCIAAPVGGRKRLRSSRHTDGSLTLGKFNMASATTVEVVPIAQGVPVSSTMLREEHAQKQRYKENTGVGDEAKDCCALFLGYLLCSPCIGCCCSCCCGKGDGDKDDDCCDCS